MPALEEVVKYEINDVGMSKILAGLGSLPFKDVYGLVEDLLNQKNQNKDDLSVPDPGADEVEGEP